MSVPTHGGVCPLCREHIHPEAIRCRHCHGDIIRRPRIGDRLRTSNPEGRTDVVLASAPTEGCPAKIVTDDRSGAYGVWGLVPEESVDGICSYAFESGIV